MAALADFLGITAFHNINNMAGAKALSRTGYCRQQLLGIDSKIFGTGLVGAHIAVAAVPRIVLIKVVQKLCPPADTALGIAQHDLKITASPGRLALVFYLIDKITLSTDVS